ncbi:hypothetical protein ACROQ8_004099 [Yersinia enterocolitica]|uniref:helix-turn-helix domain-containing protein n=1 Tax=Yersinia enterocolitica TaxID=630 RepID=UPI0005E38B72|nr:helix-turn-helix transcriptional regulator [Yersinia enterocolitica]CNI60791.1 Helix-turn-helix domain [Yersinia enterocolitica]
MMERKDGFSFEEESKESLKDRLLKLIGDRSRRAAAQDWGIKYATLNNYLTGKGSVPRPNVARQIAEAEGVSVEWILNGTNEPGKESSNGNGTKVMQQSHEPRFSPVPAHIQGLVDMLEILTTEEAEKVLRVLKKKGVDTLLEITDETNLELLSLPMTIKKLAITLKHYPESRVREIFSVDEMGEHSAVLNINKK